MISLSTRSIVAILEFLGDVAANTLTDIYWSTYCVSPTLPDELTAVLRDLHKRGVRLHLIHRPPSASKAERGLLPAKAKKTLDDLGFNFYPQHRMHAKFILATNGDTPVGLLVGSFNLTSSSLDRATELCASISDKSAQTELLAVVRQSIKDLPLNKKETYTQLAGETNVLNQALHLFHSPDSTVGHALTHSQKYAEVIQVQPSFFERLAQYFEDDYPLCLAIDELATEDPQDDSEDSGTHRTLIELCQEIDLPVRIAVMVSSIRIRLLELAEMQADLARRSHETLSRLVHYLGEGRSEIEVARILKDTPKGSKVCHAFPDIVARAESRIFPSLAKQVADLSAQYSQQ
jgi:hypothetical protein